MIAALSILDAVTGGTTAASSSVQITPNSGVAVAQPGNGAGDFSQVLNQVMTDSMGQLKTAEATAISGLQGHASVQQVVQSVTHAQQSLQTALAIRDKVVSAYQEISRMSI